MSLIWSHQTFKSGSRCLNQKKSEIPNSREIILLALKEQTALLWWELHARNKGPLGTLVHQPQVTEFCQ